MNANCHLHVPLFLPRVPSRVGRVGAGGQNFHHNNVTKSACGTSHSHFLDDSTLVHSLTAAACFIDIHRSHFRLSGSSQGCCTITPYPIPDAAVYLQRPQRTHATIPGPEPGPGGAGAGQWKQCSIIRMMHSKCSLNAILSIYYSYRYRSCWNIRIHMHVTDGERCAARRSDAGSCVLCLPWQKHVFSVVPLYRDRQGEGWGGLVGREWWWLLGYYVHRVAERHCSAADIILTWLWDNISNRRGTGVVTRAPMVEGFAIETSHRVCVCVAVCVAVCVQIRK